MAAPVQGVLTPSLLRRVGVSSGLLALYELGRRIPVIPLTDTSSAWPSSLGDAPVIPLLNLGIRPFLYGFLTVEVLSLIVPAGRRLRREGILGRGRLNRTALAVSLLVAFFQATCRAEWLIRSELLTTSSPTLTRLYLVLVWTAGAGAVYWLARKASDLGLADGFCLLVGYELIVRLWLQASELDLLPDPLVGSLGLIVLTVFGLWRFLGSPAMVDVTNSERSSLRVEVPAFSASIVPALTVGLLLGRTLLDSKLFLAVTLWRLQWSFDLMSQQLEDIRHGNLEDIEGLKSWVLLDSWFISDGTKLLIISLLIPLLCFLGYWLFNHMKRYESSLVPPAAGLLGGTQKTLRQQFRLSAVFQTAAALVFAGFCWFASFGLLEVVFFVDLVLLTALARDVVDQIRLTSRRGETVKLLDLDNVHLAAYLKALLRSKGIDLEIQGYHFRRLLFFLGPLFKMQVRVAREDEDRAWEILESQEVAEV